MDSSRFELQSIESIGLLRCNQNIPLSSYLIQRLMWNRREALLDSGSIPTDCDTVYRVTIIRDRFWAADSSSSGQGEPGEIESKLHGTAKRGCALRKVKCRDGIIALN